MSYYPGDVRDRETGELVISEVTWPSDHVLDKKLAAAVNTWYANRDDMKEARGRLSQLTQPPSKYAPKVPLHLQPTVEEIREQVAKVEAEIDEIKARPSVAPEIKAAVDDPKVMSEMLATAEKRDQEAAEAYLKAIDQLEQARNALKGTREDIARVVKLRGEDDRRARRRVPQSHVGVTNVDHALSELRREAADG